jgi:putative molybdopterin biosynthesis protein
MRERGVHLQYSFQAGGQRGGAVHNPLFDLLGAVREGGSIQHAARALGQSYRHTWGQLKHWEAQLGEPLLTWTQGQPARLTPFAERLLWAEARARARLAPHIDALRAELEQVLAEAFDGARPVLSLHAGHDLALPLLRERARDAAGLHLDLRFATSADALRALAEGRCSIAGLHLPPLPGGPAPDAALPPLPDRSRHRLIGCMRRTQGLMVAHGNPLALHRLADLPARGARFVPRRAGSATGWLTDHLRRAEGVRDAAWQRLCVAPEDTHVAVAAAVASGVADAGVGIEAAARSFGLGFVPLVEEDHVLVVAAASLDDPAVQALCALLRSPAWRAALAELPGYTPHHHAGEPVPWAQALPGWPTRPTTGVA